jgi:DnaJ family protein C protein 2
MAVLTLPLPPDDVEVSSVNHSLSCIVQKDLEASGRAFEEFYWRLLGIEIEEDQEGGQKNQKQGKQKRSDQKKRVKAAKLSEDELAADHYEELGLEKLQWEATDEQIKAAYRRLVVETHPDKTQGGDDTRFKAVQKAYEILSDPQKRLAFDSSLPFDDDIPSLKVPPEKFFDVFGDAFHRNSRWSVSRNVPHLGDWSTPIEQVESFYEFWSMFRTWREFHHDDMHNTEDADCREERRWMDRENEKERSKLQKAENKRIKDLVERARTLDPRLKKHKEDLIKKREEEKRAAYEAKQRKIEAQIQAQRDAQEAEERRKKEEIAKKREDEARRRAEIAAMKQMCIKALQPVMVERSTRELADSSLCRRDLNWVLERASYDHLSSMREVINAALTEHGGTLEDMCLDAATAVVPPFNQLLLTIESKGIDRFGMSSKRKASMTETEKKEVVPDPNKDKWSEKELVDLAKAIAKYPGGSFSRWENIATYIGTKTPDEVIRRTKLMTHQLHEGVAPSKPEALKQGDAKTPQSKAAEPDAPIPDDDLWTKAQQKQLEDAIKSLKDYKEKDKWDKVAALVEGKNRKQCTERYKYLATLFKK